jgi:hypothetical protein
MNYHTIVTHESPDLDAMLSCLLLKKFGGEKFPGIENAKIVFISSGSLYLGKRSNKLFQEGIITVDTGGGKFDTHPEDNKVDKSKLNRSASDLVAEYLGIINYPNLKKIIQYTQLHDATGFSLISKDQVHHLTSIETILYGFKLIKPNNDSQVLEYGFMVLDSIIAYFSSSNTLSIENQNEIILKYLEEYLNSQSDINKMYYEKLVEWKNRISNKDKEAFPSEEIDITVNLRTIFIGAYINPAFESKEVFRICLLSIVEREKKWLDAIEELGKQAIVKKIGKSNVCYFKSSNPLVIKASRFLLKADLTIFQENNSNSISIIIKKHSSFNGDLLSNLVRSIRISECIERNIQYENEKIISFGDAYHWFYHQSGNLIINGSDKSKSFEKSIININDLLNVIYVECSLSLNSSDNYCYPEKFIDEINRFKLAKLFK